MSSTQTSSVSPGAIGDAPVAESTRTMPTASSCTLPRFGGATAGSVVYTMYPWPHAANRLIAAPVGNPDRAMSAESTPVHVTESRAARRYALSSLARSAKNCWNATLISGSHAARDDPEFIGVRYM